MLKEDKLLKSREPIDETNFIPIDYFLNVIQDKTGWDKEEFLNKRDIGNVERKVHVRAKKPNNLDKIPIKRGKSRSELYNFVSLEYRRHDRALVTTLIKK